MSDDAREDEDKAVEGRKADAAEPAGETRPTPRPRSATSRARRIGGAGATRPGEPTTGADSDKTPDSSARRAPVTKSAAAATTTKRARRGAAGSETAAPPAATRTGAVSVSLPGWAVWVPAVAFTAAAVVFLTLFLVQRVGGDDDATFGKTRQEVLAAAKTCLATMNSYRYDQLPKYAAAGADCTTGQLTTDFKRIVSTVINKNAPSLKAVQVAKITTAGIQSVTANGKQWTVLAYGQLNVTSANVKQGRVDPFAAAVTLQRAGGKWKLSKVNTIAQASP